MSAQDYYQVRRGDTLAAIARRQGTNVEEPTRLNGIRDPNRINAGQTLKLREVKPNIAASSVTTHTTNTERKRVEVIERRELKRIVFRRNDIQWSVVAGKAEGDGYGHWWVVIDSKESYGWWPARRLGGIMETIRGVLGILNANSPAWATAKAGLSEDQDPHHDDTDELEEFHPIIDDARTTDEVIQCIRAFAKGYPKPEWAYPATARNEANCHTFQDEMLQHCELEKGTGRKIGKNRKVESTQPSKRPARLVAD